MVSGAGHGSDLAALAGRVRLRRLALLRLGDRSRAVDRPIERVMSRPPRRLLGLRDLAVEALAGRRLSVGPVVARMGLFRGLRAVLDLGRSPLAWREPSARADGLRGDAGSV